MKSLVDANLPPGFAQWLSSEGHQAQHVSDLGMLASFDRDIWKYARDRGACIVTKDEDFLLLSAWDRAGPVVVWIRIGNAIRKVLLSRLPAVWPEVVIAIECGEKVIEVR